MYKPVPTDLNFVAREAEVNAYWAENNIFEKSISQREGGPVFTFYEGPPTANGEPHIGHVITRAFKDVIPRYQAMKGHKILRKAGWDTHGLPVELEVEKKLGLDGKEQIESYGLAPFIAQCKESVWKYKGMWEDFSKIVGFWADMDDPYVTYHDDYIESVWWSLKEVWNKDLLYKGYKVVPYCARCGTPLSSHEVAQGYKDVKEASAIARFKVEGEDAYILAWTTTPWTLPSNVALCVHPEETYAKVKSGEYTYYMAQALLDTVLGEGSWTLLEAFTGKQLEGKRYEPLFAFQREVKGAFIVTCDTYVTLQDGTGVVHTAPAFGEDDARVGQRYGLPLVQNVNPKGEMTDNTDWPGVFCKKADPLILEDLKARGLLFATLDYEHSYPHCWRCDTPLIYYARESWFIKMTAVREQLIANNNKVNWVPPTIGSGRFGDWLENIQDWGISRNRYWGTPLPIWECACGHRHVVGSVAELKAMSQNCPEEIELHRPFIDAVTLKCPECGGVMHRIEEVIDCWYDSGAMPFAQWHYPFENKDIFEENFPANFISEAVDQTRGWFYSLLAIATLIFDSPAYENVIVLGHVQDENGQKMSKSKGNAIAPMDALRQYGADAIRWYFYENSAPWLPSRFHGGAVVEGQRKFMATLWNTYAFYVLYAEIDGFNPTQYKLEDCTLTLMDRWLLSRLSTLTRQMDGDYANYRVTEAARALQDFTDELSNWYVRRSRQRYWGKAMTADKIAAYMTLHTALVTLSKLAAPMIPFMAEQIYLNLVHGLDSSAPESVHLCDFPIWNMDAIDTAMEADMALVRKIVEQGRAARAGSKIKNRQPLGRMLASAGAELPADCLDIIASELNVKKVELVSDAAGLMSYSFKPQLKTLGPRYGKQLNEIREALQKLDGQAAMAQLNGEGALKLTISLGEIALTAEDLLIETVQLPGFYTVQDGPVTVALDTALTPELEEEGFVRELVSKIQTMRKDAGFNVTDRIIVAFSDNGRLRQVLTKSEQVLLDEVLADSAVIGEAVGEKVTDWDINGEAIAIGVARVR